MPWSRLTLLRAHRVEAGLLLVIQRIIEPGKRRTHDISGLQHGFEPARDDVEAAERRDRLIGRAGRLQHVARLLRASSQIVEQLLLILDRLHGLSDLIDRPMYQAGLAGLAYLRRGAVSLLNADVGPNVSAPNVPSFRNIDAGVSV